MDAAAKGLGLDKKSVLPLIATEHGGEIGKIHQWQDRYGANAIEFTEQEGEEIELDGTNSEEDYFRMIGKEEIIKYIESGNLKKFIYLE